MRMISCLRPMVGMVSFLSTIVFTTFALKLASAQEHYFQEWFFRKSVDDAVKAIETILDTKKNPVLAENADHTYEDKYGLAEFVTNSAILSSMTVFERMLGISDDVEDLRQQQEQHRQDILEWIKRHSHQNDPIILRYEQTESVTFVKEQEKSIVISETEVETTHTSGLMRQIVSDSENTKVKKKIKEYQWLVEIFYKLQLVSGGDIIELDHSLGGNIATTLSVFRELSTSPSKPRAPFQPNDHSFDLNLSWLFKQIDMDSLSVSLTRATTTESESANNNDRKVPLVATLFSIDRDSEACRTPRRNDDIQRAIDFFRKDVFKWSSNIMSLWEYLPNRLSPYVSSSPNGGEGGRRLDDDLSFFNTHVQSSNIFIPIVPIMEQQQNSTILTTADLTELLRRQKRTLDSAVTSFYQRYDEKNGRIFSIKDAKLVLYTKHLNELSSRFMDSTSYVEQMLKKQLIQAIGSEIVPEDFEQFMKYHNQRYFAAQYVPKPYSYAVRQQGHYPDGLISIERYNIATGKNEPIETIVRHLPGGKGGEGDCECQSPSIFIPINAATKVEIRGDRYLHGWMMHEWEGNRKGSQRSQFVARAHQFSSFLVIVGVMGGPDTFLPKDAIVLQNKDEVLIPLLTTVLPSAVEFKDAIASLSPEQQAFAKAFRDMQLGSSVFGVCVIQLKPQLERLLNLPDGALTKEIQLTQDLMSLFVDYQIPSDLLSYDGSPDMRTKEKVEAVQGHVVAVLEVIEKAKAKQLEEEKTKAKMREHRTMEYSSGPTAGPTGSPSTGPTAAPSFAPIPTVEPSGGPASEPSAGPTSRRSLANMEPLRSMSSEEYIEREAGDDSASDEDMNYSENTSSSTSGSSEKSAAEDFTLLPKVLDANLEKYDKTGSLKSTIIKTAPKWERKRQDNMLVPMVRSSLRTSDISSEKNKAFDLLMAISRSGALPIDAAELHVIVAVSHCFENDLMGTVIEDNIDPIERVEASMLLVASVIHNTPPGLLISPDRRTLPQGNGQS